MDAAYLEAATPRPFTVLAKKLKPFCLGHELLFQRFGNRFSIESKEEPRIEDLLTGVFVCAEPYRVGITLDNFSIPIRARLFTKMMGPSYIGRAFKLFSDYIAINTQIPEFFSKDSGTRDRTGSPTIQSVKVSLMSNLGLSEGEALNTPFSLAFWNHLTWAEAQGSIQIVDDAWRAEIKEAQASEAQVREMANKLFPRGFENA